MIAASRPHARWTKRSKRILDEAYDQAKKILRDHRDQLDLVAGELAQERNDGRGYLQTVDRPQRGSLMKAMLLDQPRQPLRLAEVVEPTLVPGQVRLRVRACGVCHTDLHVVDGELPHPKLPLIPGHEVVGIVEAVGDGVSRRPRRLSCRCAVAWFDLRSMSILPGWAGESLRSQALFTGYQLDGGYAESVVANRPFCFEVPQRFSTSRLRRCLRGIDRLPLA